ncbi:MAG TPA: hypothetical protein VNF07_00660 [Acidimicrobiales bacterium]|nr:hypothetical protein [Acidimicrobiales bacterium]
MASSSDRVKEAIRHVLDTSSSLSKMSRRELEETARTLLKSATPTKEKIEDAIEELRAQSRRGADYFGGLVQNELRRELDAAAKKRRAELADLLERVAGVFGDFRRDHSWAPAQGAAAPSEAAAEKSPAKKSPVKVSPAKKASPKKSPAKKASPKKSPAKKTAAPSKSPAKKSPAKKAPAKKAPAKRAGPTLGSSGGATSRP